MSRVMRSVKNVTMGYSSTQVKVREATSNDPWGPTGTQMSEIAKLTEYKKNGMPDGDFDDAFEILLKRLNDKGKNWRHVLKALKVLDYCLHAGSEAVVVWARDNIYYIKTLREFQCIDEQGRDVGQNVRVAAKELTSLILDDERLRSERSGRKSWKSRVEGLEEQAPPEAGTPSQRRDRRLPDEEGDAELRLALEASKHQEEEDKRKREGRTGTFDDDVDLAKAIKLSEEEEERRRQELEQQNAISLFDDDSVQVSQQPQPTGFNQGYQQGNQVDFFANPVDQNQMHGQQTGFMQNAYTGYPGQQPQQTGFPNYNNYPVSQAQTGMGMDPYGQHQQQQQSQPQQYGMPTGYNPYIQQQQTQQTQSPGSDSMQPGSNNPWATNQNTQKPLQSTPTGSNNPFAQNRPGSAKPMSSLGSLPEQKSLNTFSNQAHQGQRLQQPSSMDQQSFPLQNQQQQQSQKPVNDQYSRLNALLASGDGQDTYGNTGDLRIPAQHTAPGTFINSAGTGINRINPEATGNPFMRQQFTGMPTVNYNHQGNNNPFGTQQAPQQQQRRQQGGGNQDLIQF